MFWINSQLFPVPHGVCAGSLADLCLDGTLAQLGTCTPGTCNKFKYLFNHSYTLFVIYRIYNQSLHHCSYSITNFMTIQYTSLCVYPNTNVHDNVNYIHFITFDECKIMKHETNTNNCRKCFQYCFQMNQNIF